MDTVFKNIDSDKRDKIINSALEEFGKYGFEKASINSIVKNSHISKGFLYHYLSSKEEMYNYLQKFVINFTLNWVKEEINWNETDIFLRIKQIALIKFKLIERYPYIHKFFNQVLKDKPLEEFEGNLKEEVFALSKKVYEYNIDFSKFKDRENIKEKIDIIRWSVEKFGDEYKQKVKILKVDIDYNISWKEFDKYMDILRRAFYK